MNMPFRNRKSRYAQNVSAVIPCRNGAAFLPACLDSLLQQEPGYCPREILVVDDGSTDDTVAVVKQYRRRSRTIRLWRIEAGNANRARTFGVSRSRGDFILLLDADNWLEPGFVRLTLDALSRPDSGRGCPAFAYGDRIMHYEADWYPFRTPGGEDVERIATGVFDPERLKKGNYIDMCSMIRREAVQLDPALKYLQDWDLWLRLAAQHAYGAYVPETAFHYRIHDGNMTRQRLNDRQDKSSEKIVRRYGLPSAPKVCDGGRPQPLVSIILIAKTPAEIEKARQLLEQQTYPNREFCTSTAPGFARAYQEAMDQAVGDIIVFTETDCTPLNQNWLTELVESVEPNTIVHGLTVTDQTPNMANLALPAEIAKRFPRSPAYGAAEDTEWILRMQAAGICYKQLDVATVIHQRPFIRTAMLGRAYDYGRDWVRLSRKYGYVELDDLEKRAENERDVAIRTLQGIRAEIEKARNDDAAQGSEPLCSLPDQRD